MIRIAALCLLFAGPAIAQSSVDADAAVDRLAEAQLALQAARVAPEPVAALTATTRAFEDALIPLRASAMDAVAAFDQAKAAFDAKDPVTSQMLATLISRANAGATDAPLHPDGAVASLRSGWVRDDATEAFASKIAGLRQDLDALTQASKVRDLAVETFEDGQAGIAQARAALTQALANRAALPQRFVEDPVQSALLSATGVTFGDLTEALEATYGKGLPNDAMLAAKGRLPQPVTGRVLQAFGTQDGAGPPHSGITFATPAQALVISPTSATILFQGPLLSFDTVVVTEPSAGTMMIFAGLSEAYGTPGQIIPAGTPLGAMGGESALADMNLTSLPASESGGASQALYLEVREGQTPVDPATWFALEQ